MNLQDWLSAGAKKLESAGIGTARLDAEILLSDTLGKNRAWVIAHTDKKLPARLQNKLNKQLNQRAKHIPLAYIRQKTEFFGREFYLDHSVLEPRPESETMIEMLIEEMERRELDASHAVYDIGTGSGALAITVKLENPALTVYGTDIDQEALRVAEKNSSIHGTDVEFIKGDLLKPLSNYKLQTTNFLIIANLPYVADNYKINTAALHEPKAAIFGGPDGLDVYRSLFRQIDSRPKKPKLILTESMPYQHETLADIARDSSYSLARSDDFIQLFEPTGS